MKFSILFQDIYTGARAGTFTTEHGGIETPVFMPVGTAGTVKAVHQRELIHDIKAQIILANTYHLNLRPGIGTLEKAGGLHHFMKWKKPILTDSGGFQIYSLAQKRKITEEGVVFYSHIDGRKIYLSPERVIDIQNIIGSDIIIPLDECVPYPCSYLYAQKATSRTHNWMKRSMNYFKDINSSYGYSQTLFCIVQGSTHIDLRRISSEEAIKSQCEGNAIGGLSVGEPKEKMYELTELVCSILPKNKPRYLMGVGTPEDILECVALGVDMFDCVMPTRNARNGMLFTTEGILNIKNARWKNDFSPIDEKLGNYVSTTYSKAYLHHLIISKEYLSAQIASIHNLTFYVWLVQEARKHIISGDFSSWKKGAISQFMRRV